jgi:hypothetical protein
LGYARSRKMVSFEPLSTMLRLTPPQGRMGQAQGPRLLRGKMAICGCSPQGYSPRIGNFLCAQIYIRFCEGIRTRLWLRTSSENSNHTEETRPISFTVVRPFVVLNVPMRITRYLGTFSRSQDSDSSSSEGEAPGSIYRSMQNIHQPRGDTAAEHEGGTSEEETTDDEAMGSRASQQTAAITRPQSSLSTHRYRTPGSSSALLPNPGVPASQPQGLETLSAFGGPSTASLSSYPPYAEQAITRNLMAPHGPSVYRRPPSERSYALSAGGLSHRPPSRLALERAIESIQTQIAALSERIEIIESHSFGAQPSRLSPGPSRSSPTVAGSGSPNRVGDVISWDFDEMGLWSIVFKALARALRSIREFAILLSNSEGRSPTYVVFRRLFLDISFILCTLTLIKTVWRRTGVRRRAVSAAMRALWWALVGKTPPRDMADRGI